VILGVDTVMEGRMRQAFCSVRPPGHHAERRRAMGFCIFNNVAVGAAHALCRHGLQRVAIVDFDVHHGNGTEDIFADDPRVLFCSSFQHPFYPYSGTEADPAQAVHTPLRAGSDGTAFRRAVGEQWLPRLEAFAPELIMISAGFDAHAEDEMAGLAFGEADYRLDHAGTARTRRNAMPGAHRLHPGRRLCPRGTGTLCRGPPRRPAGQRMIQAFTLPALQAQYPKSIISGTQKCKNGKLRRNSPAGISAQPYWNRIRCGRGWTVYFLMRDGARVPLENKRGRCIRLFKTSDAALRWCQRIGFREIRINL
jgi:hypothetical protein